MDSIGSFVFIKLSEPPQRVQEQWERITRPGKDGVSLWSTGTRGEPFSVQSEAWSLTFGDARELAATYAGAPSLGALAVTFGNGYAETNHLYKVLAVRIIEIRAMVAGNIAGDANVYHGLVRAEWTLQPLYYVPPEEP